MVGKKLQSLILAAGITVALITCSSPMYETLARTTRDPFFTVPSVQSFTEDYAIVVSWPYDEAADEYILYRTRDDLYPVYSVVYRGLALEYHDRFSIDHADERYLYRLSKRRGGKIFGDLGTLGKTALGVVTGERLDAYEPNDAPGSAVELKHLAFEASSFFYGSNYLDAVSFHDDDWYYVKIPPHWMAQIVVHDKEVTDGVDSHFQVVKLNVGTETVRSKNPFNLNNHSDEWVDYYFRLTPNLDRYILDAGSIMSGYGRYVRYSITLNNLQPEI
ncbi:MAG: hypothetical protein LBJ31_10030 [Treponema sp.]|jgi:hypothetical protein|nr:hypothetical protein [Treponema sp.]